MSCIVYFFLGIGTGYSRQPYTVHLKTRFKHINSMRAERFRGGEKRVKSGLFGEVVVFEGGDPLGGVVNSVKLWRESHFPFL